MAIVYTDNTYAGQPLSPTQAYIAQALLGGPTLDREDITIFTGIKKRMPLRLASLSVVLQPEACAFNPQGDLTFGERYLDPVTMEINFQLCINDLRQSWEADNMAKGRPNEDVPGALVNFLREQMLQHIQIAIQKLIWIGDTAAGVSSELRFFDGFRKILLADGTTIKDTGPAITPANVVAELAALFALVPEAVQNDPAWRWYMATADARSLMLAQGLIDVGGQGRYVDGVRQDNNFFGEQIVVVPYLPAGTIIGARKTNLFFGTDLLADFNDVRVIDMRQTTGDDYMRYMAKFAADVNYAYGNEIIIRTIGA